MSSKIFVESHEKTYYANNDVIVIENFHDIQDEKSNDNFAIDVNHVDMKIVYFSKKFFVCRNCTNVFDSNNKLHRHLEQCKIKKLFVKIQEILTNYVDETIKKMISRLIQFDAFFIFDTSLIFRI